MVNQVDNGTSCTYVNMARPSIMPTYSCPSSSFTPDGSVCLYPCEEGTEANGSYCDPVPTILPLPTISGFQLIKCNKTPGGAKGPRGEAVNKWLCENSAPDGDSGNAYLLSLPPCAGGPGCFFKDANVVDPNKVYSYVGTNDIICYADSPGSTVYICQSPAEYINAGKTTQKEHADLTTTCDSLMNLYLDLSNNLSVLATSGSMAVTSAKQLSSMQVTLLAIYKNLCEVPGVATKPNYCPRLQTQIAALNTSITSGSSTLSNIINPYEMGISSRTTLLQEMRSMGCTVPKTWN
jgi:hypothetical protein